MAQSSKGPPVLDDDTDYEVWKKSIAAWELLTDLEAKKRGLSIFLNACKGKYFDIVSKLEIGTINCDQGVRNILAVLDRYCLSTEAQRAYAAFEQFHKFKRQPGQNVNDALLKFESLVLDLQKVKIELPTAVLAYFVLHAMDIGEENSKIARATITDLTYENMSNQIKAIADTQSGYSISSAAMASEIKTEPDTLYTRGGQSWRFRGRGGRRGGPNIGRGVRPPNNNYPSYQNNSYSGSQNNSYSRSQNSYSSQARFSGSGNRSCFVCNSPDHLSYDCPHKVNRPFSSSNTPTPRSSDISAPKCFKCQSSTHLAYACTATPDPNEPCGTVNIVLFQSTYNTASEQFLFETFGSAVIDSGAKTNVAGKVWVDRYINTLPQSDIDSITEEKVMNKFKFGDGKEVLSDVKITLPVVIGGVKQFLSTSVINSNLPLLLSFESLNRNKVIIDFGKLTMKIGDKELLLKRTTQSGHLLLPLISHTSSVNYILHIRNLKNLTLREKVNKMCKLHRQLGHSSKESMRRLLVSSGITDKTLYNAIDTVIENCQVCLKHKKKPLRPCVSEPLSDGFNSTVAIDLKTFVKDKIYIIHLICLGTRFSMAGIIHSKNADVILKAVLKLWVQYFGPPRRFLTDNGSEFSNDKFREMCEQLNVLSTTTPGESPWSNGVVERHNGILMETVKRVMDDCQCTLDIALPWAISAKNTLSSVSGFSPNVLVFGRNPNVPSVLTDYIPALSPCTHSDLVRRNLEVMHAARKGYVAAESSERIRRALRMKLRTSNDTVVENGDSVYYRRENYQGWKGPGKVIGRDGKLVVVRHGGLIYRVPLCHIIHTVKAGEMVVEEKGKVTDADSAVDREEEEPESEAVEEDVVVENNRQVDEPGAGLEDSVISERSEHDQSVDQLQAGMDVQGELRDGMDVQGELRDGSVLPDVMSTVKFRCRDSGNWQTAQVLSKGGKASGKNKYYYNIQVEGGELPKDVHWNKHVDVWRLAESVENIVLFSKCRELKESVIAAKESELDNWKSNSVYERVKDVGQPAVSSRWVMAEKRIPGSTDVRLKARLVCRGYEEDTSTLRTDSPTCSKESMRILMCCAMSNSWECKSLDIKSAFLQGFEIDRDIFMRPPTDAEESGVLWKLRRCPYGLSDAPRAWYRRVTSEFSNLNMTQSRYDEAFFYYRDQGGLKGLIVIHVDDFLYCGSINFHKDVIDGLVKVFKIRVQSYGNFKYLGLNVTQTSRCIQVDQDLYVQGLELISVSDERLQEKDSLLTKEERMEVKSKCGQLLWVAGNTRPDISFETSALCNPGKSAVVDDLLKVNKAILKVKQEKGVLRFMNIGSPDMWSLKVYCDSSHANLPDGSSQGGYIVLLSGEDDKVAPLAWQSKKLHRVTRSTLASETLATIEAVDAALLLAKQIGEVLSIEPKINVFTDCKSLYQMLHTSKVVTDKSLRVSARYLSQLFNRGEIFFNWVDSNNQLADSLTKNGMSGRKLRTVLKSCHL